MQLPQSIRNLFSSITGKKDNRELLTHCKRELVHAIWKILLDEDFIEAYKNGIVVKCFDGVNRRIYPRIFTYSADYPEKYVFLGVHADGILICLKGSPCDHSGQRQLPMSSLLDPEIHVPSRRTSQRPGCQNISS